MSQHPHQNPYPNGGPQQPGPYQQQNPYQQGQQPYYGHQQYQGQGYVPGDYPLPPGAVPQQEQPLTPSEEQGWGVLLHLGGLLVSFVVPLVVWLIFRKRSRMLDDHGKTAMNWELTLIGVYFLVGIGIFISYLGLFGSLITAEDPSTGTGFALGGFLVAIIVMVIAALVVALLDLVFSILGAVAAYKRRTFKYWAIPFIR